MSNLHAKGLHSLSDLQNPAFKLVSHSLKVNSELLNYIWGFYLVPRDRHAAYVIFWIKVVL